MNYKKLKKIKKLYFGYEEIARALDIARQSALVTCARLVKSGILIRLKRNMYVLRDRWDNLAREDKFVLTNLIQIPSYISLMTALDYYEVTTQFQRDFIESIAIRRTKEIEVEKNVFKYSKIRTGLYFGFSKVRQFFIASPEKAFLDAIYLMSLKRYSFDLTSINFDKLNIPLLKKIAKKYPPKTQKILEKYGRFKKT
jgi:predicted transcriptional regulator of viral defense system